MSVSRVREREWGKSSLHLHSGTQTKILDFKSFDGKVVRFSHVMPSGLSVCPVFTLITIRV